MTQPELLRRLPPVQMLQRVHFASVKSGWTEASAMNASHSSGIYSNGIHAGVMTVNVTSPELLAVSKCVMERVVNVPANLG